jgi:hypothetical protein
MTCHTMPGETQLIVEKQIICYLLLPLQRYSEFINFPIYLLTHSTVEKEVRILVGVLFALSGDEKWAVQACAAAGSRATCPTHIPLVHAPLKPGVPQQLPRLSTYPLVCVQVPIDEEEAAEAKPAEEKSEEEKSAEEAKDDSVEVSGALLPCAWSLVAAALASLPCRCMLPLSSFPCL